MKKIFITTCFTLVFIAAFAQSNTLKGNISNEDGEKLGGVSIIIKGTTIGTFTTHDGNFNLNTNQPLPFMIVLSFVGFYPYELEVTNWNNVSAKLSSKIFNHEVTVTGSDRRLPAK